MWLTDLAHADSDSCGGKARALARLLQAGLPVPRAFVVPATAYRDAVADLDLTTHLDNPARAHRLVLEQALMPTALVAAFADALRAIRSDTGETFVAVRSSATTEDGALAAAAGQYESVLGLRDTWQIAHAVRQCWASLWTPRAVAYRKNAAWSGVHLSPGEPSSPSMAVLVQKMVRADAAGVMFTGTSTVIEASWGLGEQLVSGHVTPDQWEVTDGTAVLRRSIGTKATRTDLIEGRLVKSEVSSADRNRPCLDDSDVLRLARLGAAIDELTGCSHDIEWAITSGKIWILQARPITAPLPARALAELHPGSEPSSLAGITGSAGQARGIARIVTSVSDFPEVRPGDILFCRTTDPAWTPLFGIAAAVITETGGLLSHAAIVAREYGIPCVLGVDGATSTIPDGAEVTVDATTARITFTPRPG